MSRKKKKTQPNLPKSFDQKRETKKAAVLGTEKKKYPPAYAMLAIGILIVTAATYWFLENRKNPATVAGTYSASSSADQVVFPVAQFDDGKARHYEYRAGDLTIKYFIIKSSDGIVRAAFDACDVCWPAGKGYFQEGDYMVCKNCGRRFQSVLVNEVKGGCNPAPLVRSVEGDRLVIQVKDILDGKQYFNFSGKA